MKVRHFGRFLPMSQVQLNSVNSRNSTLGQSILKTQVSEFVGRRGAFISAIFFVLVRGGDVDNSVPWYWQQLWQGLYNIISALPDWAELNEFHVITGSVCKQPHVTVQTTAWASISRSFFLFQSLPFIPSLAHLCGITRVDGDAYAHTHTHARRGARTKWETHTAALSRWLSCSQFSLYSYGSEPGVWCFFKGVSFFELFLSSSPYLDFSICFTLSSFLFFFLAKTGWRGRPRERERHR